MAYSLKNKKMSYSTINLLVFVLILISDIVIRINAVIGVSNGSTELVAALNFISLLGLSILCLKFRWKNKMPQSGLLVFKLFMAWSLFAFARGAFNAHGYWEWKDLLLSYFSSILVPLAIIVGLNYEVSVKAFRFMLNKLFVFGFIYIFFALAGDTVYYAYLLAPVVAPMSLFMLFVPYLKFRWRVLIVIVALMSVLLDPSYRTNIIRVVFSALLLLNYFSFNGKFISKKVLNITAGVLFCVPLLLLTLGITGVFNVFERNAERADYKVTTITGVEGKSTNLGDDTRTGLYRDVFYSMLNRDSSFFIGEGGGAGYQTNQVESLSERGRQGSEVGFLNTLLYSGAVGVLLYALVLFVPVYYAINRSNNYLCKMLGLFLAFHWVLFFIEDIVLLNTNFYSIWLAIGLCLSNKFRVLTDVEVKQFFRLNPKQVSRNAVRHRDLRLPVQVCKIKERAR